MAGRPRSPFRLACDAMKPDEMLIWTEPVKARALYYFTKDLRSQGLFYKFIRGFQNKTYVIRLA